MKCPYCGKTAKPPKCENCKAAIEQEKKVIETKKTEKEEK